MEIHNYRSPEQWAIISQHIDFQGKTVLDIGCGKGDILSRASKAGATTVTGIDKDEENVEYIRNSRSEIEIIATDVGFLGPWPKVDIAICFSVLPYLKCPLNVLQWINHHSNIALIECQYDGDGAGFAFLKENDDMEKWLLEAQFQKVQPIGYTVVLGRNTKRYIWMCGD
jgi:SAM-dependent methyltransferase